MTHESLLKEIVTAVVGHSNFVVTSEDTEKALVVHLSISQADRRRLTNEIVESIGDVLRASGGSVQKRVDLKVTYRD